MPPDKIVFGEFCFDLEREELTRAGAFVRLTTAEASLLKALARRAGEPISRDDLGEESAVSGNARTIDVQVTRLRRKIEADPKFPRYLQTVRGTGYVLMPDRSEEHTSELQSLMRISYAVFCLKKKTTQPTHHKH